MEANAFQFQAFLDIPINYPQFLFLLHYRLGKKKLKFAWVVITVLIGKLNQFASDSIVVQNNFNYVFADYFMPRHGSPFPHCDLDTSPAKPYFIMQLVLEHWSNYVSSQNI